MADTYSNELIRTLAYVDGDSAEHSVAKLHALASLAAEREKIAKGAVGCFAVRLEKIMAKDLARAVESHSSFAEDCAERAKDLREFKVRKDFIPSASILRDMISCAPLELAFFKTVLPVRNHAIKALNSYQRAIANL